MVIRYKYVAPPVSGMWKAVTGVHGGMRRVSCLRIMRWALSTVHSGSFDMALNVRNCP
jgi:hypothetical protein